MTSSSSTLPEAGAPVGTTGPGSGAHTFWTNARPDGRPLACGLGLLALLCWAGLAALGASPYSRYLHHHSLGELRIPLVLAIAAFVGAWILMIGAMMLPTTYPVLALFSAVIERRPNRRALLAWCVTGFLGVWATFGLVAYVADLGVHAAVESAPWLDARPWLIAAAVLALAGAYQFTGLKYRCLDACRSPRLFLLRRWTGRRPSLDAVALGADAGWYCLGCCWSLMLVMFAVGAGSLPFMLALGTAMAIEKNVAWGRRISSPLGVALLLAAVVVVGNGVG